LADDHIISTENQYFDKNMTKSPQRFPLIVPFSEGNPQTPGDGLRLGRHCAVRVEVAQKLQA